MNLKMEGKEQTNTAYPEMLVRNKMASSIGPIVLVTNDKITKESEIILNTVKMSNTDDVGVKSQIESALQKQTIENSDIDLHGSSDNIIHVEISESGCADDFVEQNQDSMTTDVEASEKTPIILFKWGGTSKKPLHCQICDMAFSDGVLLRDHFKKHESSRTHEQKPFPCRLCYKSFQSERSLERHQFVHSGQSMKRCKFCYKIFANKENLDLHMLLHNGQKIHQCPICEKRFACRQAVETHIHTHAKDKNFKCPYCDKTFSRKDTMVRHQETHCSIKGKRHTCVECGKSFSFLFTLKKHVRSVHGGESDGKECEVCGKFIKNRENISRHMMIHADTRPHKCQVCDRAFVQKQHLNDHMAIHSSSSTVVCKICFNVFRHRRSLNRHLHKHYTVPSKGIFVCTKCNAEFNCKIKIREHILNTHERILYCSMCKSKCQDENELAGHMLKEHSIVCKDSGIPELVNKATETEDNDLLIDKKQLEETKNDSKVHEAAQDLLRIQKFQSLSSEGFKMPLVHEDGKSDEEQPIVESAQPETTPINNILESECAENDLELNSEQNGVIYIVCNNSQVGDISDQHLISKLQQHMESTGKIGEFVIDRSLVKQSEVQTFYIPEDVNQTSSQIIHIPEAMDQSGSQNIHVPDSSNQSGFANIHIPATLNQSGLSNVHFHETMSQTGSHIVHFPETLSQPGSEIINGPEIVNQSSVTLLKQGNERLEGLENSVGNNEFSATIDNTSNMKSANNTLTDHTHYESNRSALIQSLIDYAEKIQEEEMLGEDSSETRI